MGVKKKANWQQWIGMGILLLSYVFCGVYMSKYLLRVGDLDAPFLMMLRPLPWLALGMYGAMYLQIVLHEFGHLVFGLASGYRFASFRVGSMALVKANGKLMFKKYSVAGTGGQCLMGPPDMVDGRMPVVLYNLGGSLMNLIASAGFFVAYLLTDRANVLSAIYLMAVACGLGTALANGIPLRMMAVDNDGRNAISMSKSKDAMEAVWLQLSINQQLLNGRRLKDLPEEWFDMPSDEAMRNSMVATKGILICNRLMDLHRFEEADQRMAHLLALDSDMIGLHRNILVCERMYCELIGENRQEVLDAMRTKEQLTFMQTMKSEPSVIRVAYAYALLAEKDSAKAQKLRTTFEKVAKNYPYPGDVESERELIELADCAVERPPPL